MQEIIDELLEIKPGWAGPGSRGPSKRLVENLQAVILMNLRTARTPDEVEVDPGDGSINLYWNNRSRGQSFVLIFGSHSNIIGVLSDLHCDNKYPPWQISVDEAAAIQDKLLHPTVSQLLISCKNERTRK